MSHFRVTVNGRAYDVQVEELAPGQSKLAPIQPQPAAATELVTPQPSAPASYAGPVSMDAGDKPVVAPLSGTIIAFKVKPGDQVKYGQVLLTLEALKMENEIVAPEAGTVKAVFVENGSSVTFGDVLLSLTKEF